MASKIKPKGGAINPKKSGVINPKGGAINPK